MFDFVNTLLKEEDMKKSSVLLFLTIFSSLLFTGFSLNAMPSNSTIRTLGVGESALPIEARSFAVEFSIDNAVTVDAITPTKLFSKTMSGAKVSADFRYQGYNIRYGIDNRTELKVGFLLGKIDESSFYIQAKDEEGEYSEQWISCDASIKGGVVGLKRLLTDFSNPQKVSLYLEGKYLNISNENLDKRYDGESFEFKLALINCYQSDPASRKFPSLSLYYSLANTNRDASFKGFPTKRHPQAIGAEINLNLTKNWFYSNFAFGLEKVIYDKPRVSVLPHFGATIGINFDRKD